jgi:hypothetical protein
MIPVPGSRRASPDDVTCFSHFSRRWPRSGSIGTAKHQRTRPWERPLPWETPISRPWVKRANQRLGSRHWPICPVDPGTRNVMFELCKSPPDFSIQWLAISTRTRHPSGSSQRDDCANPTAPDGIFHRPRKPLVPSRVQSIHDKSVAGPDLAASPFRLTAWVTCQKLRTLCQMAQALRSINTHR